SSGMAQPSPVPGSCGCISTCSLQELLDPWQSLDPFADSEDKPLRKGRPFLVPLGLEDMVGGKRKRKSPRKLQSFIKWFAMAPPQGAEVLPCTHPAADLEILYWKQMKERVAAQKKLQPRVMHGPAGRVCTPCPSVCPSLAMSLSLCVSPCALTAAVPPAGPRPSNSLCYEELVRRNVELFMVESQRYVQETELSQRVRCWEERMVPLLQEQESRQALDVRGYGQALVQGCSSVGHWCSFARLVAGQPPAEVSRYLMATLQLANDYVVELAQEPGLEEALDTLRLRLLTHQQAHERFQAFRLPSACP
uniref:Uncharacterized protein n=1 Tax=Melopsittacus undulatus TaxID=13146 RepID=A0A8V5GA13_MELUD